MQRSRFPKKGSSSTTPLHRRPLNPGEFSRTSAHGGNSAFNFPRRVDVTNGEVIGWDFQDDSFIVCATIDV